MDFCYVADRNGNTGKNMRPLRFLKKYRDEYF